MAIELMLGKSSDGKPMHYAVGAIIQRNGLYLLTERVDPPPGFAGIAGHVDKGEIPVRAMIREVREESGLAVVSYELIDEGETRFGNCSRGIGVHYWFLFDCSTEGEVTMDPKQSKSLEWYSIEQMRALKVQRRMEPVWEHWFTK